MSREDAYVNYRGLGGGHVLGKGRGHQVMRRVRALFLIVLSHSEEVVVKNRRLGDAGVESKSISKIPNDCNHYYSWNILPVPIFG